MPRKTLRGPLARREPRPASMRPRPDAAENGDPFNWPPFGRPASMRPRPDAAENADAVAVYGAAGAGLQ